MSLDELPCTTVDIPLTVCPSLYSSNSSICYAKVSLVETFMETCASQTSPERCVAVPGPLTHHFSIVDIMRISQSIESDLIIWSKCDGVTAIREGNRCIVWNTHHWVCSYGRRWHRNSLHISSNEGHDLAIRAKTCTNGPVISVLCAQCLDDFILVEKIKLCAGDHFIEDASDRCRKTCLGIRSYQHRIGNILSPSNRLLNKMT